MKFFKSLLMVLLSFQLLLAVDVITEKDVYMIEEPIGLEVTNKPNTKEDWIGVFRKGVPSVWGNVLQWKWVGKASSYKFKALEAGEYEVRFFPENSFNAQASVSFMVKGAVEVMTQKDSYQSKESVWLELENQPNTKDDWIGIFKKGTPSVWENVVQWKWVGEASSYAFENLEVGEYEARFFQENSYYAQASVGFTVKGSMHLKYVQHTDEEKGNLFASSNGKGNGCQKQNPCTLETAINKLKAGSVLFLRGGTYNLVKGLDISQSGTAENPIIVESYPGEVAILDGGNRSADDIRHRDNFTRFGIRIDHAEHVKIRKLEIRGMSLSGISMSGRHNVVEGCKVHGNFLVGIQLNNNGAFNTVINNIVHNNSDVGLNPEDDRTGFRQYGNGGNADGIQVVDGNNHRVYHNLVFENSDDGIDTWQSDDSEVKFNVSHHNGLGGGNGNGIKAGGNGQGENSVIEHNIAYENKSKGFDYNKGINVTFRYNTSFKNRVGFTGSESTLFEFNIAYKNGVDFYGIGEQRSNSWQVDTDAKLMSFNPDSKDFLRPVNGSVFEHMGSYADDL